jgi:hypothetical protein
MPLTAITTLIGCWVMILSWTLIGRRLQSSGSGNNYQLKLLHSFFLYMGIYFLFTFAPHVVLEAAADQFPLAMAVGYLIGHVFLYLAFLNIGRLLFALIPRLYNKEVYIYTLGLLATIGLTVATAFTMIWGERPAFDEQLGVTTFNTNPLLGIAITLFATLTVLPTAILVIMNGVSSAAARIRSYLLGGGLIILIVAGQLHDLSFTPRIYMIADLASILGLLLIATAVAFRIEERAVSHHHPVPSV